MALSVILLLLAMGSVPATAQVVPAARGGDTEANAFGMFTFEKSDYGTSFVYGGTFGADFRIRRLRFGQPAIAARLSFVPGGDVVSQNTYLFGPEWHMRVGPLRPYVDFHAGYATISYGKKTEEQIQFKVNSRHGLAYEFGGGVDYRLARKYGIRIVDFQFQNWNVGTGDLVIRNQIIHGDITYTPYQISTGFYYRFH